MEELVKFLIKNFDMKYSVAIQLEKEISADYFDKLKLMKAAGMELEFELLKALENKLIVEIRSDDELGIYYAGKALGLLLNKK